MSADPENDFKPGDNTNVLLRKILERLSAVVAASGAAGGSVTLDASDVEIGGVEIKDGNSDTRAKVRSDAPDAADNGLVVRNIPSGTQAVSGTVSVIGALTDTQLRASAVPVSGPLTDAQLRASAVPISAASLPLPSGAATNQAVVNLYDLISVEIDPKLGNIEQFTAAIVTNTSDIETLLSGNLSVIGPLTDAQLRASAVPISGTVAISGSVGVTGPLTDTQLRASAVPVSGPLTDTQLRASAVPVSGPLTDTQLRATPVPVSGTVTASGPLTDAQLRASAVPVSATQLPAALVSGRLDVNNGTWLGSTAPTVGQKTMANSVPVVISSDQGAVPVTLSGTNSTKTDLTPSSPTFSSVGVASAQAVAANANRKGLVLVNTSDTATISLGFGAAAVLNSGITLAPGDVYIMDEYTFDLGAVNAIASAASTNLAVQEYAT